MLERVLVLERIVPLRKRHGAGVEPHVHELGNAPHFTAAFAFQDHVVDVRLMKVQRFGQCGSLTPQFLDAPNRPFLFTLSANPDRNRRAPIAIARDRPILVLFQPVSETALAGFRRIPVDLLVVGDHVAGVVRRADIPGLPGVIEQRRVASPAMRIAVRISFLLEEQAARLQVGSDLRIRDFEEFAGIRSGSFDKLAAGVERLNHRQLVLLRSPVIVFAVGRRHMDDAGTIRRRDKVGADDVPGLFVDRKKAEPSLVFLADQIAAAHALDDFRAFRHHRQTILRKNQEIVFVTNLDVFDVRAHRKRDVGN